jgi:hypothetical protein
VTIPGQDAPQWRKSSRSFANGNCIEWAVPGDGTVLVRDSKDPGGLVLRFPVEAMKTFGRELREVPS